jgi:hypothetical protein
VNVLFDGVIKFDKIRFFRAAVSEGGDSESRHSVSDKSIEVVKIVCNFILIIY